MNAVERVKMLCKQSGISIARLERELGFSNGYIGQLRKGTLPNDRLAAIAKYLNVSTDYLMGFSIDARIDETQYNLMEQRAALREAKSEEEKEKIESAIAVLEEGLDDLFLVRKFCPNGKIEDEPSTTARASEKKKEPAPLEQDRLETVLIGLTTDERDRVADFVEFLKLKRDS